jgi:hypothetical protein
MSPDFVSVEAIDQCDDHIEHDWSVSFALCTCEFR